MTYAMYGNNPDAYLAQTPYARMTGLLTQVDPNQIPNAYSYLQPTFVDMNAYRTSGIPEYPSFIGGTAMMNPQIPIAQPGQYTNQTGGPSSYYYPQQQSSYPTQNNGYSQQQSYYPTQNYGYQQQQMFPQQQSYPPQQGYPPQQAYPPQGGQYYQQQTTVFYGQMPQYQPPVDLRSNVKSIVGNLVSGLDSIMIG
jgi:hypothetical protein